MAEFFPADKLFLIAGPCVLESDELNLRVGETLARLAEKIPGGIIYKASFDKANRSNREAARGPGLDAGLEALARVRKATGLPVLTDVHTPEQCAPAASVEIVSVAAPPLRVAVPSVVEPSRKVTVPVAENGVTPAVSVTGCPTALLAGEIDNETGLVQAFCQESRRLLFILDHQNSHKPDNPFLLIALLVLHDRV